MLVLGVGGIWGVREDMGMVVVWARGLATVSALSCGVVIVANGRVGCGGRATLLVLVVLSRARSLAGS